MKPFSFGCDSMKMSVFGRSEKVSYSSCLQPTPSETKVASSIMKCVVICCMVKVEPTDT